MIFKWVIMDSRTEISATILVKVLHLKIEKMPDEPLARIINFARLVLSKNQVEINNFIDQWSKHKITSQMIIDWGSMYKLLKKYDKKLSFILSVLELIDAYKVSNLFLLQYAINKIAQTSPQIKDQKLLLVITDLLILMKYYRDNQFSFSNFKKIERGIPVSQEDSDSDQSVSSIQSTRTDIDSSSDLSLSDDDSFFEDQKISNTQQSDIRFLVPLMICVVIIYYNLNQL